MPVTGYANNSLCLQTQGEIKKKASVQPLVAMARGTSLDSIHTIEACLAALTKTACHQKVSRICTDLCTLVPMRVCYVPSVLWACFTSLICNAYECISSSSLSGGALSRTTNFCLSGCADWCLWVILACFSIWLQWSLRRKAAFSSLPPVTPLIGWGSCHRRVLMSQFTAGPET